MKQEHLHLLTCHVSLILYVCEMEECGQHWTKGGGRRGELLGGVTLFCYGWCWHLFLLSFPWANIDSSQSCPALRHGKSGSLPARDFQNLQNGKRKCCICGPVYGFCSSLWKLWNFKIGYRQFWWKFFGKLKAKIQIQTFPPASLISHFNLSRWLIFYPLNISQCKST